MQQLVRHRIIEAMRERGPVSAALVLVVPVRFPPVVVTQSAVALPAAVVPETDFLRPSCLGSGFLRLGFPQRGFLQRGKESLRAEVFAVLA